MFWDDHNRVKRSRVCKPNNVYKVECNSCKCAPDGQSYTCTLNECLEEEDKNVNAERNINKDVEVFMESKVLNYLHNKIKRYSSLCFYRSFFHRYFTYYYNL